MKKQNTICIKNYLFKFFMLFLLFGCAPNKKLSKQETLIPTKTYQQLALEKFGDEVEYQLNSDKSYVLCKKMIPESVLNPNQLTEFFVYDIKHEEIIYADKIANAKISWHNNTQLLITKQKGYIENPSDTGKWSYIFDLKSKKKFAQPKAQ